MATNVVVAPAVSGCSSSGQSIGLRKREPRARTTRAATFLSQDNGNGSSAIRRLSRPSAAVASFIAISLTALLAVFAAGCESKDAAFARCRRTCAPNAIESVSSDPLWGSRCSCQQPVFCDDAADGGSR